jgi:hypothetical protein
VLTRRIPEIDRVESRYHWRGGETLTL